MYNLNLAANILDKTFPDVKYILFNDGRYVLNLSGSEVHGILPQEEEMYFSVIRSSVSKAVFSDLGEDWPGMGNRQYS